MIYGIRPLLDF